jgi:hypothetical protein
MKKGIRLIRRMAALFLVLLLSIESFGAIVSDNDGSAFITKAEFDSLKNDFQTQIDQYNTSIDSKIDGAIAAYLAGIRVSKTTELTNNLSKLQNSYDVFWSNQTGGLVTTRVNYGSSYVIQVGARGNTLNPSDARQAQATAEVSGSFVKFPIMSSNSAGGYDISFWEERKPWISYCGFFIANRTNVDGFMSGRINGIFSTNGFNPNTNNIFARQDQWWDIQASSTWGSWAMSIWGAYSTKAQNRDTKSIFIYPNAGNTYCWNESDTANSTGQDSSVAVPSLINNGNWSGTSTAAPQTYSGTLNIVGYTTQATAKFPWCHTQYTYNQLYDSRISTITGVRFPITAGLLVSDGVGPGTLKLKCFGTNAGNLEVRIFNADNTSQLGSTKIFTVSTSTQTFSIDLKSLESKQKFNVWIKYLPSTKSELFIESVLYESEFT